MLNQNDLALALNETPFTSDLVRIIAGEAKLSQADRQALNVAAQELEVAARACANLYGQLCDANHRIVALTDQLKMARGGQQPNLLMSTGPAQSLAHFGEYRTLR